MALAMIRMGQNEDLCPGVLAACADVVRLAGVAGGNRVLRVIPHGDATTPILNMTRTEILVSVTTTL